MVNSVSRSDGRLIRRIVSIEQDGLVVVPSLGNGCSLTHSTSGLAVASEETLLFEAARRVAAARPLQL